MRKIVLILAILLIPVLVQAETWRVTWAACTATSQACVPTSYYNSTYGSSPSGVPVTGKLTIQATCFTVGSGATDTDFNFMYDTQSTNAHSLFDNIGEASNKSMGITPGGNFITFTADNDDAGSSVTPYCDVVVW